MTNDLPELPAEVWLCTNGGMLGFHRLGVQVQHWVGPMVELLPQLVAMEGWERTRFFWVELPHWRQPTSYQQVAAFEATLQRRLEEEEATP